MTAVSERPVPLVAPAQLRLTLSSNVAAIAVVVLLLSMFALVATVALSPVLGAIWLFVTLAVALVDAMFATPTRVDVQDGDVTFGFVGREKTYRGNELLVRSDARDRLTVAARGRRGALARLRGDASTVNALTGAGARVIRKSS